MGLVERLQAAIARFEQSSEQAAVDELVRTVREGTTATPSVRATLIGALAARLDNEHFGIGARLATLAGALVETGVAPGPLGPAILPPLERALRAARRFVELADEIDEDDSAPADGGLFVGEKHLSDASVAELAKRDIEAARGFESLQVWYRPAAAAWSRDRATLRNAQEAPGLHSAVAALANHAEGAWWLHALLQTCLETPFVVLIPELQEAWELVLDGCVHNEQFLVLLSAKLCPSLQRLGIDAPAPDDVLAIVRGEGPQEAEASYEARFNLYSWQAVDRDSSRPVDGRFTWHAPTGSGDIWLPGDFRPSRVEPLAGRRVVALVTSTITRVIRAARMFPALPASISSVRQLTEPEAKRWTDLVAPYFFAPRSEPPKPRRWWRR